MRSALRSATLGVAPKFDKEIVSVGDAKVEVRQPHMKARSAILAAGKAVNEDATVGDFAAMQVQAVIECCFDPETGEQIFEQADFDALVKSPVGSPIDQLATAALKLLNGKGAATVAGNSERTPSDSSSSQ